MKGTNNSIETLLNEYDVARFYGLSVATVRRWRWLKTGPVYRRIGGAAVRYRAADLEAYLQSRPTGGGNSAAAQ